MFAISHEETLAAIEHMADNNLKYYDAHCPNCRRANRVERFKLEASYPGWQQAIKDMTKQADQAQAAEKAPAKASTGAKTTPAKAPVKEPAKKQPVPKKAPSKPVKGPTAKKTAPKGKKK
jgi:formate-dependent nitrite reductase cytochrome c552 subunit